MWPVWVMSVKFQPADTALKIKINNHTTNEQTIETNGSNFNGNHLDHTKIKISVI